jgi:hypothetical protein
MQVEAVERTAVDFLVERVDAGNVLSAMALGAHLSAGKIGRELRDRSRAWLHKNFVEVARGGAVVPGAAGGGGCVGDRVR